MVIPRFRKDYENKSIKELVKEQQEIMQQIISFENRYILETEEKDDDEIMMCPSPTVIWRCASEDLIMITQLIDEKTRDKNGIGIDF